MNIKIRPGLLFDAQTIVNFQLTMAMETENLKLDLATATAGVQAIFDNPERGKYFVAELDGKVVASLLIIPEWSDWRNGFVWWIHSVYVEPKLRGQKIFSQMYEFIKAKTTLQFNVENLLDHQYYAATSNSNTFITPGAPRTFIGSVKVEF